jgi:hypothetical protein
MNTNVDVVPLSLIINYNDFFLGILPVVVSLVILMILVISYLLFKKRFQLHENRQNDVHQNHEQTPIIPNNQLHN